MTAPTRSGVLGTAAATAAATLVVGLVNPNDGGHYPTCPLLALTGLYCPFCGGLRVVYDLSHFDLGGAMARNPLAVIGLPLVALLWLLWAQQAFTGRRLYRLPLWTTWASLAVLGVFMVLRNVPGWTWLSPA